MRIGIICDSQYGNTQQLAETLANELEATDSVLITSVSSGTSELRDHVDLLIVGGPPPGASPDTGGFTVEAATPYRTHPAEWIVQKAGLRAAALVVMATHGRTGHSARQSAVSLGACSSTGPRHWCWCGPTCRACKPTLVPPKLLEMTGGVSKG